MVLRATRLHDGLQPGLAWLVFARDRSRFESQYPDLAIEKLAFMPWLTYFVSGGVTARYLIPRFMNGSGRADRLLQPLEPLFSLHWHICVRKKSKEG